MSGRTPLRGGPLRRTPMRAVSSKRRRQNAQRRARLHEAYGTDPACKIRWDDGCRGWAEDAHEPAMRSRGADITDPDQAVPTCRHCHDSVHAHPVEATRRGWLVPSWEAS